MPATSPGELHELLQASGLLEGNGEDRARQLLMEAASAEAARQALVAAKLITPWQAEKLIEGKSQGFFLGNYRLLDQLGAGAMGCVYLAEHRVMRHRVAIKVLARRLIGKPGYIQRFQQEARAAAAVNHPRIVRAFDVDSIKGLHFMVMEFVAGDNLREIVQREGPLTVERAAEYTKQVAEGLEAAHRGGLIHRDIKPSNLILEDSGHVRILDLGLARIIDEEQTSVTLANDTKLIGTVDYLAPEQARDCHHIDSRADIYSLGCTLYFLLSGQPPYAEGSLTQRIIQHQTEPPQDIRKLRPDCPDYLAEICHQMLAKRPEDRFQTAAEVAEAIAAKTARGAVKSASRLPSAAGVTARTRSPAPNRTTSDDIGLAPFEEEANKSTVAIAPRPKQAPAPRPVVAVALASPPAPTPSLFDELDSLTHAASSSGSLDEVPFTSSHVISGSSVSHGSSACEASNSGRQSFRERALQLVSEKDEQTGKMSPALWFCILAGILLGLILAGVGISYLSSFQQQRIKGKGQESSLPAEYRLSPHAPPTTILARSLGAGNDLWPVVGAGIHGDERSAQGSFAS